MLSTEMQSITCRGSIVRENLVYRIQKNMQSRQQTRKINKYNEQRRSTFVWVEAKEVKKKIQCQINNPQESYLKIYRYLKILQAFSHQGLEEGS